MFNRLFGILTYKSEHTVHLRASHIEWAINVTSTTASRLPGIGQEAEIFIYMYHKEDQMSLFGFSEEDERRIFLDLIKVSGIGPKQALRILSGMNPKMFIQTLDAGDADNLARIPGLGKKTAQKIILALRGKLSLHEEKSEAYADIVQALVDMGYERKNAEKAVDEAAGKLQEEVRDRTDLEKLIFKNAIVELSK